MDRPFDPALKTLAELKPADWLSLVGRRRCRVTVEDADIGTLIPGAADKLLRVHDNPEYLLHLNFESGHFRRELPLRYSDEIAHALFGEVVGMEESSTFQAIVRKGRAEEARAVVFLQGETKFGAPDEDTRSAINAMSDLGQLHGLLVRLVTAASWQELVPLPRRRNPRRRTS
jgi:hypothetical protein